MPKAVIYARYSCSKQREASIEDQLRVCRAWCLKEGYDIVAEYCDRAASGRSDARPEFQRMVENAGESDVVVVYMMDRFSRDVYDAPIYKKRLRGKGVKVVSATEAVPDGPEAILIESIYEAMAAMESAHIAQRTRRGMEGNALKCHHNGVKVFGYDCGEDGKYVVNEREAEVVREVFSRRLAGEAPNSIALDLAARGWRTYRGNACSYTMVRNMLKNEKYIGVYEWGGTRMEGGVPQIIERSVYDMAQKVVSKKVRHEESWADYAFAGGRAVCMACGNNLVGVSGYSGTGKRYDYYRCSKRCGCKPVRADWLESAVVDELRRMLSDRETALGIAQKISDAITDEDARMKVEEAKRSRAEAQRGIENLMRAVEAGMDYQDVAMRLDELKAQRDRAILDETLWSKRAVVDAEDFADFLQAGASLGDRDLLDAFVWRVIVGDDEIVVVLSYNVGDEPARLVYSRNQNCEPGISEFAEIRSGSLKTNSYELGDGCSAYLAHNRVMLAFPRP